MAPRSRREKGDGAIRERPKGTPNTRWEGRYTVPQTGERLSFYGPSYDWVKAELHRRLAKLADGIIPAKATKLTVAVYLEDWLATTARLKVEHNVWLTYAGYLRNHVIPALGKVQLEQLTADQVERFLASRLNPCGPHQRPLAPRSIKQLRSILSSAFKAAVRRQLMPVNLARDAEIVRIERHNPTFLTPVQATVFVGALPTHRLGTLYAVALGCGLRLGEALGICWEDLDLETGNLVLAHQLKRIPGEWRLTEAKRDSARTVTVPEIALVMLRYHRAQQQATDRATPPPAVWRTLVFRRPEGLPYHEEFVTRTLQKFTAELELPRLTFHELRHSAASLLIKSGAGLKEVSDFLGHSSVGITGDLYAHLYADQSQRNAVRMNGMLTPANATEITEKHGEYGEYGETPVPLETRPVPRKKVANRAIRGTDKGYTETAPAAGPRKVPRKQAQQHR